jgi:hypothetical protein
MQPQDVVQPEPSADPQEGRLLEARIEKRATRSNVPSRNRLDEFALVLVYEAVDGKIGKVVKEGSR